MGRAKPKDEGHCPYAGRGGLKLRFALDHFSIDVRGTVAADLGCHIGGFADCLLQSGAAKVYAVDTGYGILAWKLRQDPRVIVCERTNALHWTPPAPVDIVTIDVGWTRQSLILAAASIMLRANGTILSLVKPQYEAPRELLRHGVLREESIELVLQETRQGIPAELALVGEARSPYVGSGGNVEYWWRLKRPA